MKALSLRKCAKVVYKTLKTLYNIVKGYNNNP